MAPPDKDMTDHDRIVEMHKDIGFILTGVGDIKEAVKEHDTRIDDLESFRDKASIILKIVGLTSIVGGISAATARMSGLI